MACENTVACSRCGRSGLIVPFESRFRVPKRVYTKHTGDDSLSAMRLGFLGLASSTQVRMGQREIQEVAESQCSVLLWKLSTYLHSLSQDGYPLQ